MVDLDKDVMYVKGVGENKAKLLNKIGICTLKDLITYYPRGYEDRGKVKPICECEDKQEVLIEAVAVANLRQIALRGRVKSMQKLEVQDETGKLEITWFNQAYLKDVFKIGEKYKFFGKVKMLHGRPTMTSPVFEEESKSKTTGKIIPVYGLTYKLTGNVIRSIMESGIKEIESSLPETLPKYLIDKYELDNINEAVKKIHFPSDFSEFKSARKRLVFEELLTMQLALLELKNNYKDEKEGIAFSKTIKAQECIDKLPFELTNAQTRVIGEIEENMEKSSTMNRLVQGDVGSGKTVVAMASIYKAVKSGYQAALMAPTAILAVQHNENFKKILEDIGIKCELLVSGITKKKKEDILNRLKLGEIDILIGTHAILEDNVEFKKLGLVVTDEQHRFGVKQRAKISQKGISPDVLVMTATPIPRTLALILYGDLDISVIDELPPNRQQIDTFAVGKDMNDRVNNFLKEQLDEGRQGYIVCPLVEENEEMDLKSVEKIFDEYSEKIFPKYEVDFIHGKLKQKEKDEIMSRFKNAQIDLLISTTVIEVGVDVPNSNIMVIENAERFGLAQLHQLRGRVGRGKYKSYCILKFEGHGKVLKQRMDVMCKTNDGFVISEKDLELRGSGDFFGTMQHGMPEFKIVNLFQDIESLKEIQRLAQEIIQNDPKLEKEENKLLKELIKEKFTQKIEM